MTVHYTHSYLLNPGHAITVDLVGLGGTGSQMLSNLARMNAALLRLNHPGLFVTCWDNDIVTESNIGRQLFSPAELGMNKAVAMVTRVNRFFGFDWAAEPAVFYGRKGEHSNILISCIDTAEGRLSIAEAAEPNEKSAPFNRRLYWMDLGNLKRTGQCILGTICSIKQPKSEHQTRAKLKTVEKYFNLKKIKEEDQGPSCSMAEALSKQDLFINSTLAQFGSALLWKLFREGMIRHHGCYVNLESFIVNPIKIK